MTVPSPARVLRNGLVIVPEPMTAVAQAAHGRILGALTRGVGGDG
jgi:hypothetical protein